MEQNSQFPYSRTWLEGLSTGELAKLAEDTGLDIPPGLERIFIIEELLLESSYEKIESSESELNIISSRMDTADIPKQYNISFVEVIVRDPLWIFVHWEIRAHDRELYETANDFAGYFLRVYQLDEGELLPKSKENSFVIQIDADDSARYLSFTEHSYTDSNCYIIKLCVNRGGLELQLAISQPFKLYKPAESGNIVSNPLIRLSGITDFNTIQTINRSSRVKA